jgi:hypothetical protein
MSKRSTSAEAPTPAKVISLEQARRIRELSSRDDEYAYQARILGMDKLSLLEEMVRFQQQRSESGELSIEMMARGKYLFKALEERAESSELKGLARSYRRHLEHEMAEKLQEVTR